MIIETERLILRPWKMEDAEVLYNLAKDPLVGPNTGWPVHTSVENSADTLKNILINEDTFAVCLKDNQPIGSIGIKEAEQSQIKITDKEKELGYWLGVSYWGHGYMKEAIQAIENYAFNDLMCNALWCGYYEGNERSRKCMERCGFKFHHTELNKPCCPLNCTFTVHYTFLSKEQWLNNK